MSGDTRRYFKKERYPRGRTHTHEEAGPEAPVVFPDRGDRLAATARWPGHRGAGLLRSAGEEHRRARRAQAGSREILAERRRPTVRKGGGAVQEVHEEMGGESRPAGR